MASISIAMSEEYPRIPWSVKGEFSDPAIIKVVAVISRVMPIVINISTLFVTL